MGFKLRHNRESGYPEYDEIDEVDENNKGNHIHKWGGYSRGNGEYYEGGHGEYTDEEEKKEGGRAFKKNRGED